MRAVPYQQRRINVKLKIRDNYKYAVACPTSMGVRITPEYRMAVHNSDRFYLQATSAESISLSFMSASAAVSLSTSEP